MAYNLPYTGNRLLEVVASEMNNTATSFDPQEPAGSCCRQRDVRTTAAVPIQQKDKKLKGLFKALPAPPSILHPHAHAQKPTKSTWFAGLMFQRQR